MWINAKGDQEMKDNILSRYKTIALAMLVSFIAILLSAIAFTSSDASVVSVNNKGKVKGLKKGTARVYCFADNGVLKTIKVKVK